MIEFLSSWAKSLGVTIVIVSIFEMLLPNNKTKKYIRVILGIFILFNIISPFINNKNKLSLTSIDIENYINTQNETINQTSMDNRIQDLYEQELEKNIIDKIENQGYKVNKCNVSANIVKNSENEENTINKITLKIEKGKNLETKNPEEQNKTMENKIVTQIQKIKEIDTRINKENTESEKNVQEESNSTKVSRSDIQNVKKIFDRRIWGERKMFRNKLKKLISNNEEEEQSGNDKRKIENLVFFVVILIITVVAINLIWNGKKDTKQQGINDSSKKLATNENNNTNNETINSNNLEEKLKNILSKIQGVGNVEVCLNYSESSEIVAMYNENSKVSTTEESDTSGGNRKIQETDTQKDIIYQEENGKKTPITQKTIQPKIEGAIITATGVNNATTKNNIIQAVEAVTGLATHKIQVFEMN